MARLVIAYDPLSRSGGLADGASTIRGSFRPCIWCMSDTGGNASCPICGRMQASYVCPPHHLPPASLLAGRYFVGVALGEGRSGISYIAYDYLLDRTVAIKELFPSSIVTRDNNKSSEVIGVEGISPGLLVHQTSRFIKEARSLANRRVGSSAIAVFDIFSENGTGYIVMERVQGMLLRDLLAKSGYLSLSETLSLMDTVFATLEELHEAGLIHRDVSPENIVIDDRGGRLVDYGLACAYRDTQSFDVGYRRAYVSPEQYVGGGQGPWTDVYSLCVILYECLTGHLPPSAFNRLAGERLEPLSEQGVCIDSPHEAAILRGMALPVSERIQSVADLRNALYAPVRDAVSPPT